MRLALLLLLSPLIPWGWWLVESRLVAKQNGIQVLEGPPAIGAFLLSGRYRHSSGAQCFTNNRAHGLLPFIGCRLQLSELVIG